MGCAKKRPGRAGLNTATPAGKESIRGDEPRTTTTTNPNRAKDVGEEEFDMRLIIEFEASRHWREPDCEPPRPFRTVRGCPCCDHNLLIEYFPDGRLNLTPFEYQTPDPNNLDDDIPF
jgi:hypothetical protein